MARTIIVISVFALPIIGAPWTAGAESMSPIGADVAPISTDKESPSNGRSRGRRRALLDGRALLTAG